MGYGICEQCTNYEAQQQACIKGLSLPRAALLGTCINWAPYATNLAKCSSMPVLSDAERRAQIIADRQKQYGDPRVCGALLGKYNAVLQYAIDSGYSAHGDSFNGMVQMLHSKLARFLHQPDKQDTFDDLVNYLTLARDNAQSTAGNPSQEGV